MTPNGIHQFFKENDKVTIQTQLRLNFFLKKFILKTVCGGRESLKLEKREIEFKNWFQVVTVLFFNRIIFLHTVSTYEFILIRLRTIYNLRTEN